MEHGLLMSLMSNPMQLHAKGFCSLLFAVQRKGCRGAQHQLFALCIAGMWSLILSQLPLRSLPGEIQWKDGFVALQQPS